MPAAVVLAVTLAFAGAAPSTAPASAPVTAPIDRRIKVLVLDVKSDALTDAERATLTNLIAGRLGERPELEVLSNEDVKQLVALQGQAQEIGMSSNCTNDACLAEIAGALGAGVVVASQAGKLGEAVVISLAIFDASKAKSVSRKSVEGNSLGEVAHKLGPALDELVVPLLAMFAHARTPTPTAPATPPVSAPSAPVSAPTVSTPEASAGRAAERYGAAAMQICVDKLDPEQWYFCNRSQAFTENAFVRLYRERTGAHDIDAHDVDRNSGRVLNAVSFGAVAVAGAAALGLALGCGALQTCGAPLSGEIFGDGPVTNGPAVNTLLAALLGITGVIAGGFGEVNALTADGDGTTRDHTLGERDARAAVARYNSALSAAIARE